MMVNHKIRDVCNPHIRSQSSTARKKEATMTQQEKKPAIGLHGMLIVGEETIYVSHLPMWMTPHNFQVILEVTFRGPDQPQARYVEDRKTTGTRLYTLNPLKQWDIRGLAPAGPQRLPSRASFQATIWRNHFESHPV